MYDPTIGQFLSEDPIDFDGQDSNLRRYVANSPLANVDPDGLRGISIYVNSATIPANFDAAAVSVELQKMFAAAGIKIPISIFVSSRKPDPSGESYYNGVEYDRQSWSWSFGWWNCHPGAAIAGGVERLLWEPWVPFTKATAFYTHFVDFTTTSAPFSIASTARNETVINVTAMNQAATGATAVNWDVFYANLLMHEVIYLGYLDYFDDPGASMGNLESNKLDPFTPMTLPPYVKRKLDWYFSAPCK